MKTMIMMIAILFLSYNISHAADKWDMEDYALASTFTVAIVIDWGQTRDIATRGYYTDEYEATFNCNNNDVIVGYSNKSIDYDRYPTTISYGQRIKCPLVKTEFIGKYEKEYFETNPILGKHPSVEEVDKYMPLSILTVLTTAYFLPSKWRKLLLTSASLIELDFVNKNHKIGLKVKF